MTDTLTGFLHSASDRLHPVIRPASEVRRVAQRHRRVRRLSGIAVAVTVTVTVGLALGLASPTTWSSQPADHPTTSPSPAVSPSQLSAGPGVTLSSRFVSPRMNYTISYPAGWTATPATRVGLDRTNVIFSPASDLFESKNLDYFSVAIEDIPATLTESQWLQRNPGGTPPTDGTGTEFGCYPRSFSDYRPTVVDGHPAWINPRTWDHGSTSGLCSDPVVAVIVGRAVYEFRATQSPDKGCNVGCFNRDLFERMIASVRFTTHP